MDSEIRVNKINSRTGVGTITLSPTGVDFTGIATVATLKATTGIVTTLSATGNATVGGTLNVTGETTFATHINLGDSDKAKFGASGDLEIYHNGSHSYIADEGAGELIISGSRIQLMNAARGEKAIDFVQDGAVDIYYDGSKKLETTSDGITVSGNVTADGLSLGDSEKALFGASNDLQIYHDGSHSYVLDNGTGDLRLASNSIIRITKGDSETCAAFNVDGASELYYDNTKKFETTSSGLIIHEDTDKTISFTSSIGEIGNVTGFQAINTAGSSLVDFGMRATTLRFATGSAERLRIDSSGNLGIGCDDPQYQIDLSASSLDHLFTGAINAEQDGGDYALKLTALGKSGGRTGSVRFITGTSSPGSEVARFTTAGLTFGGDTAAANALDDYEEGTFEPIFRAASGTFNTVTYHGDTGGRYTKVGNLVMVTGCVRLSGGTLDTSNQSSTDTLCIGGLPFTNNARTNGDNADNHGTLRVPAWSGANCPQFIQSRQNANFCNLYFISSLGGIHSTSSVSQLTNNSMVQFTLVYTSG